MGCSPLSATNLSPSACLLRKFLRPKRRVATDLWVDKNQSGCVAVGGQCAGSFLFEQSWQEVGEIAAPIYPGVAAIALIIDMADALALEHRAGRRSRLMQEIVLAHGVVDQAELARAAPQ